MYLSQLRKGKYGQIMTKHEKLANQLGLATYEYIKNYVARYKKYDDWTLRDIDKVYALCQPHIK